MPKTPPIAFYIHIPFCETKCPYCDFNTYSRIESLIPSYVEALITEIKLWGTLLNRPIVRSVFFGGGTPSYLPAEDISNILEAVSTSFSIEYGAEVTLEANPGDFTKCKLSTYIESGINRLSIGVQSFDDHLLGMLGRRHSADDALEAYQLAEEAGFGNVSLDLMYGLPDQTIESWKSTLKSALMIRPTHVSMYCLTLEEGTPMEAWVRSGKMADPDPDTAADMYQIAEVVMESAGYRHYEISNWSLHGHESRHNLTYWQSQPYLGVGPGAHSYMDNYRFANLKQPREYINKLLTIRNSHSGRNLDRLRCHKDVFDFVPTVDSCEQIDRKMAMAETLMMGLRLDVGISIAAFEKCFQQTPRSAYPSVIEDLLSIGLLKMEADRLILTPRGRMLGNEVFSRFF